MDVLLSIKPRYVKSILEGGKRYEFRKTIFKNRKIDRICIYSSSPVIERTAGDPGSISFGLGQDILRSERNLLGFNNCEDFAINTESIVSGTIFGRKFFESIQVVSGEIHSGLEQLNTPTGSFQ